MGMYNYKAKNLEGNIIKGSMEALNREDVVQSLRGREYYPISIDLFVDRSFLNVELFNKVTTKDLSIFCRQFAFVLGSGTPIIRCLEICIEQSSSKKMKEVLVRTREQIQRGRSLSDCFKYEKDIPEIMTNLIEAGEVSGKLDKIVADLAEYYDSIYKQEQKIKSALSYPKFVSFFAIMIVVFLIIFVVPNFVENLIDIGGEIPTLTKVIIGISNFLTRNWLFVLLVTGVVYIVKKFILDKDEQHREKRDIGKLKMPVLGSIHKQIVSARFAKTLSILVSSGLGIIQTLEISAKVVGNIYIKNKINIAKEDIKKGNAIGKTLEDMQLFPLMLTQMITLGEETGTLEEVLERTSKFYDGEVENATSKLVSSIEPVMIVSLSAIVLVIVLSMILPLTSMMEGINNIKR